MTDTKSLINVGDWSKPANTLIERVSDAIGGAFRPRQIQRLARAEAAARIITAHAEIEISEIERRGLQRLVKVEGEQQENIETITALAAEQLNDNAKPDELDKDWIVNFFDKCRLVSDKDMQIIWSNILAGEATNPNSFSKRTVNFVPNMDKNDASMFTLFCSFVWSIGDKTPLVYDIDDEVYKNNDISFSLLKHLADIGLITFDLAPGYLLREIPKLTAVSYFDRNIVIELPLDKDNDFEIGSVLLTKIGYELAKICGSSPLDEFFDYVIGVWSLKNYSPFTPLP